MKTKIEKIESRNFWLMWWLMLLNSLSATVLYKGELVAVELVGRNFSASTIDVYCMLFLSACAVLSVVLTLDGKWADNIDNARRKSLRGGLGKLAVLCIVGGDAGYLAIKGHWFNATVFALHIFIYYWWFRYNYDEKIAARDEAALIVAKKALEDDDFKAFAPAKLVTRIYEVK